MGKRAKVDPGRGKAAPITALRGDRVRELRERRTWTQMELAYHSKVHQGDISGIEASRRDVKSSTLLRLVVALDTSADYLLGLTDSPAKAR